jgi:hypothetical protein
MKNVSPNQEKISPIWVIFRVQIYIPTMLRLCLCTFVVGGFPEEVYGLCRVQIYTPTNEAKYRRNKYTWKTVSQIYTPTNKIKNRRNNIHERLSHFLCVCMFVVVDFIKQLRHKIRLFQVELSKLIFSFFILQLKQLVLMYGSLHVKKAKNQYKGVLPETMLTRNSSL